MYAAAAAASNPYAAAAGLQGTGLISLAATQNPALAAASTAAAPSAVAGSTGNPLLDAYNQYAAMAAASGVYTTSAQQVATTGSALTTSGLDAQASKSEN